jgi:hypothetical protein
MYFWRNSVRTIFEIRGAIETLYMEHGFKNSLSEQPKALQDAFHRLREDISKSHAVLKHIRNSIGGHVLHNSVKKALSDTDFDQSGMIQLGDCVKDTHYRFASELTIQMWLSEKSTPGRKAEIEQTLKLTAELTRALEAIDIVFATYINSRKLLQ